MSLKGGIEGGLEAGGRKFADGYGEAGRCWYRECKCCRQCLVTLLVLVFLMAMALLAERCFGLVRTAYK
ncbi:hypothetical protein M0802_007285 [Mischocyttarus mexicanus]|nr:hypothetical protein M0802_007285 [Mischocyttarus mexicanus]